MRILYLFNKTGKLEIMNNKKFINYIPFIGWIYTMLFLHQDESMKNHIKNGFLFFLIFTSFPIFLTFATVLVPNDMRIFRFTVTSLINLSHLIYFILCIIGTIKISQNKNFDLPFPKKFSNIIEL